MWLYFRWLFACNIKWVWCAVRLAGWRRWNQWELGPGTKTVFGDASSPYCICCWLQTAMFVNIKCILYHPPVLVSLMTLFTSVCCLCCQYYGIRELANLQGEWRTGRKLRTALPATGTVSAAGISSAFSGCFCLACGLVPGPCMSTAFCGR